MPQAEPAPPRSPKQAAAAMEALPASHMTGRAERLCPAAATAPPSGTSSGILGTVRTRRAVPSFVIGYSGIPSFPQARGKAPTGSLKGYQLSLLQEIIITKKNNPSCL